ncbi:MAG TPA: retropepsin-like aspartic protease [Thermoplasmata archaeon]|jgi:hypothetical protein
MPAEDGVVAQLEFNGKGGVRNPGQSGRYSFILDTGAQPSSVDLTVVEDLGIRASDMIGRTYDTLAGGSEAEMAIVPGLLYLQHDHRLSRLPHATWEYSVFLVNFHIPVGVFLDPLGEGMGAERLLGMDVRQILTHQGREWMRPAKTTPDIPKSKWIYWDLAPNLRIGFGKRVKLPNYPYDARPSEYQKLDREIQWWQFRKEQGIG